VFISTRVAKKKQGVMRASYGVTSVWMVLWSNSVLLQGPGIYLRPGI